MTELLRRLLELDGDLFLRINGGLHDLAERQPEIGTALRAANEFGSGWVLVLVLVGIVAVERTFPRGLRRTVEMGVAAFAAGYGAWLLKKAIERPRPQTVLADAFARGDVGVAFGEVIRGASFPSGHTAQAFAVAVVFCVWSGTIPVAWRRWIVRFSVLAIAGLTGLARIYGGAHFPLDVAAGLVFGLLCGAAVAWTSRRLLGPWTLPPPYPS